MTKTRLGISKAVYYEDQGKLLVTGWVLPAQMCEFLTISTTERAQLGTPKTGLKRPDVLEKYPGYEDEACGWELEAVLPSRIDNEKVIASVNCEGISLARGAPIKILENTPATRRLDGSVSLKDAAHDHEQRLLKKFFSPKNPEFPAAVAWVEGLRDYISGTAFQKLRDTLFKKPSLFSDKRNWRKYLLSEIADGNKIDLLGNPVAFATLNDARVLIEEILVNDVYGLRRIEPPARVIDAGASNGLFAYYVKTLYPDAHMLNIEPSPANLDLLRENLAPFAGEHAPIIRSGALTGAGGTVCIKIPKQGQEAGGLGATAVHRMKPRGWELEAVEVESFLLADLLDTHVDYFKCDIEGAEYDAILAAGDKIEKIRQLAIEIHCDVDDYPNKFSALVKFLTDHHFSVACFEGAPNPGEFFRGGYAQSFMLAGKNMA